MMITVKKVLFICMDLFLIIPKHHFSIGQLLNHELNLGTKFSNQFTISGMNDPYEQKNLRRGLPKQAYNVERLRRCSILENKLKAIEGVDNFGSMDPKELNLVPNLVILPKFKMPNFEIFDGTKCPKTHLAMYCKK